MNGIGNIIKDYYRLHGKTDVSEDKIRQIEEYYKGDHRKLIGALEMQFRSKELTDDKYQKILSHYNFDPAVSVKKKESPSGTTSDFTVAQRAAVGGLDRTTARDKGLMKVPSVTPDLKVNDPEPDSYWKDLMERFASGVAGAGVMASRIPRMLERLASLPRNMAIDRMYDQLESDGVMTKEERQKVEAPTREIFSKFNTVAGLTQQGVEAIENNTVTDWLEKQQETFAQKSQRYDQSIEQLWKSGERGKALGQAGLMAAESLPVTLTAAFAGPSGLAMIGLGSGGEKQEKLEEGNVDEATAALNASLTGFAEMVFEGVGTAPIGGLIKGAIKKGGKEAAKSAVKKGVMGQLSNAYKKIGLYTAPLQEGLSEAATTLAQNLIDKFTVDPERDIMEGVIDSAVVGAMTGGGLGAVGVAAKAVRGKEGQTENQAPQTGEAAPAVAGQTEAQGIAETQAVTEQTPGEVTEQAPVTEQAEAVTGQAQVAEQAAPEVAEPYVIPGTDQAIDAGQAEAIPQNVPQGTIRNKEDVARELEAKFDLSTEEAGAASEIFDAVANTWAERNNRNKEDWYQERIAGIERGDQQTTERLKRTGGQFQIVGEKAATVIKGRKDALEEAKKLEEQGVPAEDIWKKTRWEKGADGKWRTEFSDRHTKVKIPFDQVEPSKQYALKDFFHFPELYKMYPALADLPVKVDKSDSKKKGTFKFTEFAVEVRPDGIEVNYGSPSIKSNEDVRNTLLHELQHAVQVLEGFYTGGINVKEITTKEAFRKYLSQAFEVEARNVQARRDMSIEERTQTPLSATEDTPRADQITGLSPTVQFQQEQAAVEFLDDGRAIIYALTDPNVSSPVHELAHVFERELTDEQVRTVLDWTGDKQWTRDTSEKFARGFEKYLSKGEAPTPKLQPIFDQFKKWLMDIYEGVISYKGKPIRLNAPMKELYDSLLTPPSVQPPTSQTDTQVDSPGKRRGFETRSIPDAAERDSAKAVVKEIIDKDPSFFDQMHLQDMADKAAEEVDRMGGPEAAADQMLTDEFRESINLKNIPRVQAQRQISLYGMGKIMEQAMKDGNKEVVNRLFSKIQRLEQDIAADGTRTGQGSAILALWKALTPEGQVSMHLLRAEKSNERLLNEQNEKGESNLDLLKEFERRLNEKAQELAEKMAENEQLQKKIDKLQNAKPKKTTKEKIEQIKDRRDKLYQKYKDNRNLFTTGGLSPEGIEYAVGVAITYIEEGIVRIADLKTKLTNYFQDKHGRPLTDADAEKVAKDAMQKITTKKQRDYKIKIKEIAQKHFAEKNEDGKRFGQRVAEELGLNQDAAEAFENEFNKIVGMEAEKIFHRTVGTSRLPVKRMSRGMRHQVMTAINLGAMDNEFMSGIFAAKYGLISPMTPEQRTKMRQLAEAVQSFPVGSLFYNKAVIEISRYTDSLLPHKMWSKDNMADLWIALNYANMLSGYTTTMLNLMSSGSNLILKPFVRATNITSYYRALRTSKNLSEFIERAPVPLRGLVSKAQVLAHASRVGTDQAFETFANGDLNPKEIEQLNKRKDLKVAELERNKYGEGKRFRPIYITIGGKQIDFNIYNLAKYVGRNLAAQDRFMTNIGYEAEIYDIIRRKKIDEGLRGNELRQAVMDSYMARRADMGAIEAKLAEEVATRERTSGKSVTERQKRIRRREMLIEQMTTIEERTEAMNLAKEQVFTGDRYGMIATMADAIGRAVNSNKRMALLAKPFVPFTKVVGNVTEYMLDFTPFYGFFRANGVSLSRFLKSDGASRNAAMGVEGTRAYEEQIGRAWFGTLAFLGTAMMLAGNDEDDFIYITGGEAGSPDYGQPESNVRPKYTLFINKEPVFTFLNIPNLAIPLALIGNYSDQARKMSDEELANRTGAAMLAMGLESIRRTAGMGLDMSFLSGVSDLLTLIEDTMGTVDPNKKDTEGKIEKVKKALTKAYVGYATRPLPQNNNMIRQVQSLFDPTSYSQKDIESILNYSLNIHRYTNKPSLDVFGNPVKTLPGENFLPIAHWTGIKGNDPKWEFLVYNDAIPTKISNRDYVIKGEYRQLEVDELYAFQREAGRIFSDKLKEFMDQTTPEQLEEMKNTKVMVRGDQKNVIQKQVSSLWSAAKKQAKVELGW